MEKIGTWFSSISKQINFPAPEKDANSNFNDENSQKGRIDDENSQKLDRMDENSRKIDRTEQTSPKRDDSNENIDEPVENLQEKVENSAENVKLNGKSNEIGENAANFKNFAANFDLPKAYAGKFVSGFASLANKLAHTNPTDLKNVLDPQAYLREIDAENEKFSKEMTEKAKIRDENLILSPVWRGMPEETLIKKQILMLSLDSRNFLRDPPQETDFHFDYDSNVPLALAMLQEDPNLRKMRFQLVPKRIKEEKFWRNYFYRISLIKQTTALRNIEEVMASSNLSNDENQPNVSGSPSDTAAAISDTPVQLAAMHSPAAEERDHVTNQMLGHGDEYFASDMGTLPDHSDPDLLAARQELGIIGSEEVEPNRNNATNGNEWENEEFISDLNDYEVVEGNGGNQQKTESDWEHELSELLAQKDAKN